MTIIEVLLTLFFGALPAFSSNYSFPDNFRFGVGTSSYQIEGGWNEGGKGENIWDYYLHQNPDYIADRSNGDVACDFYHKWREDVKIIKNLGVNFYRFSIAWPRIVPLGFKGSAVNEEGVRFYSEFIDALLAEGIQPFVTIYHWDLPVTLQEKGGWLNETIIDDYLYYAKILFQRYGDRVKQWVSFNEIAVFCEVGYSKGVAAPFWKDAGIGGYKCSHNALLSHGHVYRMYEKEFKPKQKGELGLTVDCIWCEPLRDTDEDRESVTRFLHFFHGRYLNPIMNGNYPTIMIERINELSEKQGYKMSRLPEFTPEEVEMLKGSWDFLGINHYSTALCTAKHDFPQPSLQSDSGVAISMRPGGAASKSHPPGFRALLNYLKEVFNNPPIIITENGWGDAETKINDIDRVIYHTKYITKLLEAIHEDGCNVIGYSIWSLMDNFEWSFGYLTKYGLVQIDFDSPNRTRTPRDSYRLYQNVIAKRMLP